MNTQLTPRTAPSLVNKKDNYICGCGKGLDGDVITSEMLCASIKA